MHKRPLPLQTLATIDLLNSSNGAEDLVSDVEGSSDDMAFSYPARDYDCLTCDDRDDEITANLDNRKSVSATMDPEEIDDPSDISDFAYSKTQHWELEVEI